ncbi:hypothetical protein V6U81_04875 [Micromonospora sp. CPCC 205711]|uniref:hypothetical protein n=1 Tax=Micromonospora sp. CPCC 205547 TaxID=3122400 RepID=UPI002FEFC28C
MTADLPAPAVTAGGGVPQVCARHGEPAIRHQKVLFRSRTPGWVYILLPFGVLVFAIVAAVLQKRVKAAAWPFCAECARLRTRRLLIGLGVVALAILGVVVVAVAVPQGSDAAGMIVVLFVFALLVGLGFVAASGWGGIASGHVSADGALLQVRKPHPRFAEQAEAIRIAVEQHWAAQRWQQAQALGNPATAQWQQPVPPQTQWQQPPEPAGAPPQPPYQQP